MPDTQSSIENLADQLNQLNNELRVIRSVLDEIREQLSRGLQNGRVVLSLVEPDECDSQADVELDGSVIDLAIRMQSSLTTFFQDIRAALDEKSTHSLPETQKETEVLKPPESETNRNSASNTTTSSHARPKVTSLFDDAAFDPLPVKSDKPEIEQKDSEKSNALPEEAPEPSVNTQQKCLKHAFNTGQSVQFTHDGKRLSGEIISLPNTFEVIVEVADSEDVYYVSLDQLNKPPLTVHEKFERWVAEVRDPAKANSEGIRKIITRYGKAEFAYEIAQIAEDKWAVSWHVSYRCGSFLGNSFPWKLNSLREECLQSAIENARKFFSAEQDDPAQNKARSEMLHKLKPSLGPFPEPNPDPARSHPLTPSIDR